MPHVFSARSQEQVFHYLGRPLETPESSNKPETPEKKWVCNKWRHYYYYYHYYHRHYFASITPHRHSQTLSVKKFASLNVYIASGLLATKDGPLDDFQVQISWAQRTQDRRSIHQLIKEQQPPKLRRSEHRWSGQWQQWQHREPTSWLLSICYAQSNLWLLFCGLFQLIFATVIGAKRYPVPILN